MSTGGHTYTYLDNGIVSVYGNGLYTLTRIHEGVCRPHELAARPTAPVLLHQHCC